LSGIQASSETPLSPRVLVGLNRRSAQISHPVAFSEKAAVTAVELKGKLRASALGDHWIRHPRVQECNTRSMLT
jgi:hypothetical protein